MKQMECKKGDLLIISYSFEPNNPADYIYKALDTEVVKFIETRPRYTPHSDETPIYI